MDKRSRLFRTKYKNETRTPIKAPGQGILLAAEKEILATSQAARVIYKFGGVMNLWRLINELSPGFITFPSIYRWKYAKDRGGTGGIIPTRMMPVIFKVARIQGILLDAWDFYPGKTQK